jgi:hypothetical protein
VAAATPCTDARTEPSRPTRSTSSTAARAEFSGSGAELTSTLSELVWGPTGIDHVAELFAAVESVPETFTSGDQGMACGMEIPVGATAGSLVGENCGTGSDETEPAAGFAALVKSTDVETMNCTTGEPVEYVITLSSIVGSVEGTFCFGREIGSTMNRESVPGTV